MHTDLQIGTHANRFYTSLPHGVSLTSISHAGGLEAGQMRCGEHTDWGSLAFLIQDEHGGLEVSKQSLAMYTREVNTVAAEIPRLPIEGKRVNVYLLR